ncbi:MAG: hydroxymethylbilane synthase [Anaerolineae bacterium]|nr:hydroxymethylbilane synthase [Anaerolineae bacterium]
MSEQLGTIRLGTRGSDLARWQTNHVRELLLAAHPGLEAETVVISTQGDRVLDTPLPLLGGKGLFTAELEAALHSGEIDLAVHSLKDLPTENPAGLIIGAILTRENPADVLVSRAGYTLATLPQGAVVGTSSRRRAAQLLHQRPDLQTADIRGNVDTRVRKALDLDGPYDAIILAYAGLTRLSRAEVISEILSPEAMLPAPGQGALGIQCRDDATSRALLTPLYHLETALAVRAERAFLAALGGGCSVPVAAYATAEAGQFRLTGRVSAVDGRQQIEVTTLFEARDDAALAAGQILAEQALAQGADRLLEAAS